MQNTISFPAPLQVGRVAPTLTTSEADLLIITDGAFMKKSQYTVYATTNLAAGSTTSITLYYYISPDNGTTWVPLSLYATATGIQTRRQVVLDSTTYVASNITSMSDNIPLPATTQFKITGKYTGGSAPATVVWVMARDN